MRSNINMAASVIVDLITVFCPNVLTSEINHSTVGEDSSTDPIR